MSREERSDKEGAASEVGGKPGKMMLWKPSKEHVKKGVDHCIALLSQIRAEKYLWDLAT